MKNDLAGKLELTALGIVGVHFLIVVMHSAAHEILSVKASASQLAFIFPVIIVAPIAAGFLMFKAKRSGAALLAISMTGAFLFGLFYHFIFETHDHIAHVAHLQPEIWSVIFKATAYLLAFSELCGALAGLLILKNLDSLEHYAARTGF